VIVCCNYLFHEKWEGISFPRVEVAEEGVSMRGNVHITNLRSIINFHAEMCNYPVYNITDIMLGVRTFLLAIGLAVVAYFWNGSTQLHITNKIEATYDYIIGVLLIVSHYFVAQKG